MQQRYTARGMSLIELVVVMGLLAALATVALTSLEGLGDRDRVDTTRHRLDMIRKTVVGDGVEYSRFLSDMGRPLAAHYRSDSGNSLSAEFLWELWEPGLYVPGAAVPIDGLSAVNLSAITTKLQTISALEPFQGWDGPYLDVAYGKFYDGFGNEFYLKKSATDSWKESNNFVTSSSSHSYVFNIKSGGANGDDDDYVTPAEWTEEDTELYPNDAVSNPNCSLYVSIRIRDYETGKWIPPDSTGIPSSIDVRTTATPSSVSAGKYVQYANQLYLCRKINDSDGDFYGETDLTSDLDSLFRENGAGSPLKDFVIDNEVWWVKKNSLNALRVVILSPFAPLAPGTVNTRQITFWKGNSSGTFDGTDFDVKDSESEGDFSALDASWKGVADLKIDKLSTDEQGITPGLRRIFVYGYYNMPSSTDYLNAYCSTIQTMELQPGSNHITVYLTGNL